MADDAKRLPQLDPALEKEIDKALAEPNPPWTIDTFTELFHEISTDRRMKSVGFFGKARSLKELLEKTGLAEAELKAWLVKRNGFALHEFSDGVMKWDYSPALRDVTREREAQTA